MLWDRFGWGPKDTEEFTLKEIRYLFTVLEQQRVSRDAIENLGRPTPEKHERFMAQLAEEAEHKMKRTDQGTQPPKSNK